MKTKEELLLEAVQLLQRASDRLQDYYGEFNEALSAEIEEFINRK